MAALPSLFRSQRAARRLHDRACSPGRVSLWVRPCWSEWLMAHGFVSSSRHAIEAMLRKGTLERHSRTNPRSPGCPLRCTGCVRVHSDLCVCVCVCVCVCLYICARVCVIVVGWVAFTGSMDFVCPETDAGAGHSAAIVIGGAQVSSADMYALWR